METIEFPQRRRWNLFIRKKGYEYAEVVNLPNEAKSILSLRIHVHLRYFRLNIQASRTVVIKWNYFFNSPS